MSDERDPRLLAALRHAPDRDAAPPREVSERILAAARAAVGPAVPVWKRWLDAFARPQVAGAFGTLAIATLVGVMWATRDPLPAANAPAVAAQPTLRPDAAREALATPPPIASVPAADTSRAAPPPPLRRDAARRNEARSDTAAPTARADALAEKQAEAPPPAAPAAQAQPMTQGAATGGMAADSAIAGRLRASASAPTLPAPAFTPLAKARSAEPSGALGAALQDAPAWVTPNGRRVQGDPQRRWWAVVQTATAGRWQPIERAPSAAPALTLEIDGRAAVRIWLDADAIVVTDAEGRTFRAPVGAPAARDWQAELARW